MQARCVNPPVEVYTPALREFQSGQCVLTVGDTNALAWGAYAAEHVWVHGLYIHAPPQGDSQAITAKQTIRDSFKFYPIVWLTDTSIYGGAGLYTSTSLFAAGA